MSTCVECGIDPFDTEDGEVAYRFRDVRCSGCECSPAIECEDRIVCVDCAGAP